MKVLAIMGSPRKKDTYNICRLIEEEINAAEQVEFKYLFLKDMNLEFCRGCMLCIMKGEELCPIKDAALSIWNEMNEADAVIFSSPVYARQVTALMKNFIDRSAYIFHRPCFFEKTALVVVSTASSGLKEVTDYLTSVAHSFGFNVIGSLGVISTAFDYAPNYKARIIDQIEVISMKLLETMKTRKRPDPTISDLIAFRIFREKATHIERDKEFWQKKGWFDKEYYLDLPINPFKQFIVNLQFKKILKTNRANRK
ncbi:flavodoxin family protein [bacterium]|nr:flavodoxin family protein [bacterium]